MIRTLLAVAGVVFLYSFAKSKGVNLASNVQRTTNGLPLSGTARTSGHFPTYSSATAQDLNASSSLVTAFTGLAKIFQPTPDSPTVLDIRANSGSVPHAPTPTSAYGTVTAPEMSQVLPQSWNGVNPPIFSGAPVMPNFQPANDAGVATGTVPFAPPTLNPVFDGAGSLGYGAGSNYDELNAFDLGFDGSIPSEPAPLSSADLYNTDLATI